MTISITPQIQINKRNQKSFKGLMNVKFNKNFDPQKYGKDFLAFEEFKNAPAFKYLFEHADVKATFNKIIEHDSQRTRTVLHLAVKPLEKEKNSSKRIIKSICESVRNHFIKDSWKKHWIEGVEDRTKNESNLLFKKLSKITVDDIKSIFSI